MNPDDCNKDIYEKYNELLEVKKMLEKENARLYQEIDEMRNQQALFKRSLARLAYGV